MSVKRGSIPKPDPDAALSPADFAEVFKTIPTDWILIGGQAVAYWATYYRLDGAVTSKDIDFWGKNKLKELAKKLNTEVHTPHRYERTWLTGVVRITASGQKTTIELLHKVPGLDVENVIQVALPVPVNDDGTELHVLTPVSLLLTKLYALRHFDQTDRNDLTHLQIAIAASREFIAEAIQKNVKFGLWNCNRVMVAQKIKQHRQMEEQYGFKLLEAVPIDHIKRLADTPSFVGHDKLAKFVTEHWARATEGKV